MPTTDDDAIRRLLDEQVAAWNAGDSIGWCKDFTPDAAFVNILGMRFEGRGENARRHGELFASIFHGSRLQAYDITIRTFGERTAIADVVLDLAGARALPPGIRATTQDGVLRTRMHYVLRREGGRWCIVFSQNTAVMPLPLQD